MNITTDRKQIVIVSTSALQDLCGVRNRTGKRENHALFFSPDVELLVVSTRSRFSDHDCWWQELVSDQNVFCEDTFGLAVPRSGEYGPYIPAGWLRLYNHLGLGWPIDEDRVEVHWIDAACHLQSLGYHVRW